MKAFKDCVAKVGDINTKMGGFAFRCCYQVEFYFFMLKSVLLYQRTFSSLEFEDRGYVNCPTNEEWDKGEKICEFLHPFYQNR